MHYIAVLIGDVSHSIAWGDVLSNAASILQGIVAAAAIWFFLSRSAKKRLSTALQQMVEPTLSKLADSLDSLSERLDQFHEAMQHTHSETKSEIAVIADKADKAHELATLALKATTLKENPDTGGKE